MPIGGSASRVGKAKRAHQLFATKEMVGTAQVRLCPLSRPLIEIVPAPHPPLSAHRHRLLAAHGANLRRRLHRPHCRGRKIHPRRRRARGRGDAVHPPHLGVADDPGKCRPVGARRSHDGAEPAAPENAGWAHDTEGPDDMPAHVKTMLTATSLQIPVLSGGLALGTWQAIYLIEHRVRRIAARSCCSSSGLTGLDPQKENRPRSAPRPACSMLCGAIRRTAEITW